MNNERMIASNNFNAYQSNKYVFVVRSERFCVLLNFLNTIFRSVEEDHLGTDWTVVFQSLFVPLFLAE